MDDNGIKNIEDWYKNKPYVKEICSFDKNMDDNEAIKQVYKRIKEYDPNVKTETEKGLWAIFCRRKDEKYKCLQVGSSYNINKEIKFNEVQKKAKTSSAKPLYNLTDIQQTASALFGMSPKQTLNIVQSLY